MKANFPVIWVDDNKEFMESLRDRLEEFLESKGFGLDLSFYEAKEESLFQQLNTKDVELIIVDYSLGDEKGDALIRDIRQRGNYQEIVFYSQSGISKEMRQSLEGVFFTNRQDAWSRIKNILDWKSRRYSDFATLRGWIVADAIELELLLDDALRKFFDQHEMQFERLIDMHGLFDFGKRLTALQGLLKDKLSILNEANDKSERCQKLKSCKDTLGTFDKEIIAVRNAIAHNREEIDGDGNKTVKSKASGGSTLVFTEQKVTEIRRNLRKHRVNLLELQQWIPNK